MPSPDEERIDQIISLLTSLECKFVLVGGFAVAIRALPRFTKDMDFAVAVQSDRETEKLLLRLQSAGYLVSSLLENKQDGRITAVRLLTPESKSTDPDFDLLFNATGIEDSLVKSGELLNITRRSKALVAARGHLIAMKVLSYDEVRRPQDMIDIRALLKAATKSDIQLAKKAVRAIDHAKTSSRKSCERGLAKILKKFRI